ncbi:MAG TPA: TIGR03943 family protein [Candidatus Methylacidiphilales bacterium]|nr:TIGR03943 family protein [Candidatus Methylacidiphilales bacterium]
MTDRLSRQIIFFAPAAVMSAWAVVMLHTIASGHINRYVSPMFQNYVLAAGIVLLLLSALHLLLYQPGADQSPATQRLRQLGRWLVLLVPIIAASVLSPSALSNTTMLNRQADSTAGAIPMPTFSSATQEDISDAMAASPNEPAPVEVTDLITLSNSSDQMEKFVGRKVRVVGLFESDGNTHKLVRWIMWCCAADAKPVSVELSGNLAGGWKNDQWIEVTGTAQFPSTLGHAIPQIAVDGVKATNEPDEPYLSP